MVKTFDLECDIEDIPGEYIGAIRILNKKAVLKSFPGRTITTREEVLQQWDGNTWNDIKELYEEGY